jgi:hypothetical protein
MQALDQKNLEHKNQFQEVVNEGKGIPICNGHTKITHLTVGSFDVDDEGTPKKGSPFKQYPEPSMVLFVSCQECSFLEVIETLYK